MKKLLLCLMISSSITVFSDLKEKAEVLFYAAQQGDLERVKIALDDSDTNVNYQLSRIQSRNDFGRTALMMAANTDQPNTIRL